MNNYKKNTLIKISLILVLLLLMFSSGYEIYKLNGSAAAGKSNFRFQGAAPSGQSQNKNLNGTMPQGQNKMPGGNPPSMHSNRRDGNSNNYAIEVIIYSIIFIVSAASLFVMAIKNRLKNFEISEKFLIPVLICIALFLRLFIAVILPSFSGDLSLFKDWATAAGKNFITVYLNSRNADYPPLYMYVLAVIGKIGNTSAFSSYFNLLLKLPSIFADIITSVLIYRLAGKHLSRNMSIVLAAFYLFNPAVLVNSSVWGQVDSFFTMILILGVCMLSEGKVGVSGVFFTAAVLMKPQGIIFLPVLFFELVRLKSVKEFVKTAFISLATAVLIALPFMLTNGVTWIFKLYSGTVGEYPYASVNAFNFFNLIGKNYTKDTETILGISYHNLGMAAIVLVTILTFAIYIKGNNKKLASAAALIEISGVFTFASSMHERYLFPAVALSILAYIYLKDKRILAIIIGFSITVFSNTYYVLLQSGRSGNSPVAIVISALNILLFVYSSKVLIDISRNRGGVKID